MLRTKSKGSRSVARRCAAIIFLTCLVAFFVLSQLPNAVSAASGDLDGTFANGGIVTTDFFGADDDASAVAIQADGKIVAAGFTTDPGSLQTDSALIRYNTDGNLDTSFGPDHDGKVVTASGSGTEPDLTAHGVAIQADGTIVTAGGTDSSFALSRYDTDGSLDRSSFDFTGIAYAIAIRPSSQ